jgi:GNAT superfamily N-acetyltransferase
MDISLGHASCTLEPFESEGLPEGSVKQITNLYVPEAYRRQGYARALLTHLCARADSEQYALMLEPEGELEPKDLIAMYQEHGFTELQPDPLLLVRFPKEVNEYIKPSVGTIAILNAAGVPFH